MIVTAREFNQRPTAVQKQSKIAPVFITHRGQMESVLLSYAEYQRLCGKKPSLAEALAYPAADAVEVEFPRAELVEREVEF